MNDDMQRLRHPEQSPARQPAAKARTKPAADSEPAGVTGYTLRDDGLYWAKSDDAMPIKLCGWLRVLSHTMNRDDADVGLLLSFRHYITGGTVEWVAPRRLLYAEGCAELVGGLVDRGLWLSTNPAARRALAAYLVGSQPGNTVRLVRTVGWHGDAFVLPDGVVGATPEPLRYQPRGQAPAHFQTAGTLAGWRESVGTLAVGNPLLVLSIGMALAAPLLRLVGLDSGGFHLYGKSKDGKTAICDLAGSVWGKPKGYRVTWSGTATGIEYASETFNDLPMVLDEIGLAKPQDVHLVIYQLSQGVGKARGRADGGLRELTRWTCAVLSNGEHDLSTYLASGGIKVKAGQLVRFINLPAARAHGAFDALHGHGSHAELVASLYRSAGQHYGTAGPAFMGKLIEAGAERLREVADDALRAFAARVLPGDASGQARHACHYFALAALAGELASEWDLTGWPAGAATEACAELFAGWLGQRGGAGEHEHAEYIRHLQAFLEKNGQGMFTPFQGEDAPPPTEEAHRPRTLYQAGFVREEKEYTSGQIYDGGRDGEPAPVGKVVSTARTYYITPSAWRDTVFAGLDARAAARHLLVLGVLDGGREGGKASPYRKVRLPGMGSKPVNCYVVGPKLWEIEA
ncbi:DUF927 domain-containing protein [Chitinimonas sp.]|uniref:DUF927 domain-containing protein n=1 Tax=Chitinimonas sp. TaxID=1934313 RepID=UPI0035AE6342